jgi:hypothetical protein
VNVASVGRPTHLANHHTTPQFCFMHTTFCAKVQLTPKLYAGEGRLKEIGYTFGHENCTFHSRVPRIHNVCVSATPRRTPFLVIFIISWQLIEQTVNAVRIRARSKRPGTTNLHSAHWTVVAVRQPAFNACFMIHVLKHTQENQPRSQNTPSGKNGQR